MKARHIMAGLLMLCFCLSVTEAASSTGDTKSIVNDHVTANTQDVDQAAAGRANFVYTFKLNEVYKVYCMKNRLVDIQLQTGEKILSLFGAEPGDWLIETDYSGTGTGSQGHVIVQPTKEAISTTLTVLTDRRIYHLLLFARDFHTPIINWAYPQDEQLLRIKNQELQAKQEAEVIAMSAVAPDNLNFGYKVKGKRYPWRPLQAFDDGVKTYIQMPALMATTEAPALFLKIEKALALVNYRVKNGYYIVDRLGAFFEMRVGKQVIRIVKVARRSGAE